MNRSAIVRNRLTPKQAHVLSNIRRVRYTDHKIPGVYVALPFIDGTCCYLQIKSLRLRGFISFRKGSRSHSGQPLRPPAFTYTDKAITLMDGIAL